MTLKTALMGLGALLAGCTAASGRSISYNSAVPAKASNVSHQPQSPKEPVGSLLHILDDDRKMVVTYTRDAFQLNPRNPHVTATAKIYPAITSWQELVTGQGTLLEAYSCTGRINRNDRFIASLCDEMPDGIRERIESPYISLDNFSLFGDIYSLMPVRVSEGK